MPGTPPFYGCHAHLDNIFNAARNNDLKRLRRFVEEGDEIDIDERFGHFGQMTALHIATEIGHVDVIRYLVEQGADVEKMTGSCFTPLMIASLYEQFDAAQCLLQEGADVNMANPRNETALHFAACNGNIEIATLLMFRGADLNMRTFDKLPIDTASTEEMKQVIRAEPERRNQQPRKRCTDEGHSTAAASASAQEEEEGEGEQSNKRQRLDEGGAEAEEGKVAEEDELSEPSDNEDDGNWCEALQNFDLTTVWPCLRALVKKIWCESATICKYCN